ncbi:MAG: ATP-grasp domain-containing protein [Bdellovibrionaceae bacterium]|nr:ATP-grasp domain-containing protein [Pseudobdellovibrionaceae bacterium]
MPETTSPERLPSRIGLLGGGQLARMLALAAAPQGMSAAVMSGKADDPAAQVTNAWKKGDPANENDLREFCADLDALTFESEFYDMNVVAKIARETPRLFVYPRPEVMAEIQDRRTQKALLDRFKIPTSPWVRVDSPTELATAAATLGYPFVLKKAQGGYDGYGTFYVRQPEDLARVRDVAPFPAIAEKAVKFSRELAFMIFRNRAGDVAVYPLVESRQRDSRCDFVLGPLKHRGLEAMVKRFRKALKDIDYVGALGVEMFDTGRELWVNELAPRVHNTGHYSQNALSFDQFQMHLLCARGGKLPQPVPLTKAFVMANILGEGETPPRLNAPLTGRLHWYGKAESRPGRKMGHINYAGASLETLYKTARRERAGLFRK